MPPRPGVQVPHEFGELLGVVDGQQEVERAINVIPE
jgi:hypothetical protein